MNNNLYNFTNGLSTLGPDDMLLISEKLNQIEPGVGEIARNVSLIENLTFLDWVSGAFIITLIIFTMMPQLKKIGARFSKRVKA